MKGIAHFSAGIAFVSFFQEAVRAGADGNPLYFILGGVFGLMPDTLDFKFYKFLYRRSDNDCMIIPDPLDPDPQDMANGIAKAISDAFARGIPVSVKLNTIRLGTDLWQQYKVRFDVTGRRIVVSIGPVVMTDQSVVQEHPVRKKEASAQLPCGIKLDYEADTTVDILDGPTFLMVPADEKRITPVFIPWHREWSHSLVIGLLFALTGVVIWDWLAGLAIFGAYGAHIMLDQLGFMGSNLFYPFVRSRRTGGLRLLHSSDMLPNFSAVWLSCLAIFWNLYSDIQYQIPFFNPLKLVFYGALVPLAIVLLAGKVCHLRERQTAAKFRKGTDPFE